MQNAREITNTQVAESQGSADMKEYLGKKFIVHSITYQSSQYGKIMFAEVSDTEEGERGRLFVRGVKPQERLQMIDNTKQFPVEATFIQKNGSYEIV